MECDITVASCSLRKREGTQPLLMQLIVTALEHNPTELPMK